MEIASKPKKYFILNQSNIEKYIKELKPKTDLLKNKKIETNIILKNIKIKFVTILNKN